MSQKNSNLFSSSSSSSIYSFTPVSFHVLLCSQNRTNGREFTDRKNAPGDFFFNFFFPFLFPFFFFLRLFILFYVLLFASHSSHILVFLLCFAFRVWPFLVWLPEVFMFLFNESKQKNICIFFASILRFLGWQNLRVYFLFLFFFFPPRKAILVDRPRQWNVDIPFQSQNDKSRAECSTRKKQNIKTNKKPV